MVEENGPVGLDLDHVGLPSAPGGEVPSDAVATSGGVVEIDPVQVLPGRGIGVVLGDQPEGPVSDVGRSEERRGVGDKEEVEAFSDGSSSRPALGPSSRRRVRSPARQVQPFTKPACQ